MFKLGISCHNMWCIEGTFDVEIAADLRHIVTNNLAFAEDYIMSRKVSPFVQSYTYNPRDKTVYILVEFWSDDDNAVEEYVDYCNRRVFDLPNP